jgi:hypothetical protein
LAEVAENPRASLQFRTAQDPMMEAEMRELIEQAGRVKTQRVRIGEQ